MSGENFEYLTVEFSALWGTTGSKRLAERKLEFSTDHSSYQVESIVKTMTEIGWSITDVRIHTDYNAKGEYVSINSGDVLCAVFDALITDPEHAGTVIAYGELFGWNDAEPFEHTRYGRSYQESFHGVYREGSNFAKEWTYACNEELMENLPWWLEHSIDWAEVYDNIQSDFSTFEYGNEIYVFAA